MGSIDEFQVQGATEEGVNDVSGFFYLDNKDLLFMSTQKVENNNGFVTASFFKFMV